MRFFGGSRKSHIRTKAGRARARQRQINPHESALAALFEALEARQVMSAAPLVVETIQWNGRDTQVCDDSYVFRLNPVNQASAINPSQLQFNAPSLQSGWTARPLGLGFYSLTAPGTSLATVQAWAARAGVAAVEPNFVVSPTTSAGGAERPVGTSAVPGSTVLTASSRQISAAAPAAVDPDLGSQWGLTKIEAPAAWLKTRGSPNVIVAVMGSGIQADHPDLAANMWTRPANVPTTVTGVNGYDFVDNDDTPEDTTGLGTAMAGIIGAVGGNDTGAQGISGVAPTVKLFAAKVDNGLNQQAIDTTIEAMLRIVQLKTEYFQPFEVVVSANSGLRSESALEREAIRTLGSVGILYVTNAGDANGDPNSGAAGLDLDGVNSFPSNYSAILDNVLTVAATTQADAKRLESRHGNERIVQIAAPGDEILTTLPGGTFGTRSGTAMAAAHVAGAAALLKSYRSDARMPDIKKAILDGADKITALNDDVMLGRRLNVNKSLDVLRTSPLGPGNILPVVTVTNVSVVEGNAGRSTIGVTFRLNQPAAANQPVSVSYATGNVSAFAGRDFIAQSGVVSFRGFEMEKTVQFRVIGNTRPENDRSFLVTVDQGKSRNVLVPGGLTSAVVTILDDDVIVPQAPTQGDALLPRITVAPVYPSGSTRVAEGAPATFDVVLSRASDKTISVNYRTADIRTQAGGLATPHLDYTPTSGNLIFRPGELRKTITVNTLTDSVEDENEVIDIILSQPVNAALGLATGAVLGAPLPPAPPPGASGFQILVVFPDTSFTSSQQAAFTSAAARWAEIITGDLPDVVDNGVTIDDVMIEARAPSIDGAGGILGQAGPTAFRGGARGLPYKGVMEFDSVDVARMESEGRFNAVILHEMAHVLGVGTMWEPFGLLVGAGTANPLFTGANAVREYNALFGVTAAGVPVENTGGPGTRDGHWRESIFRAELMTGWVERPGTPMPISRITVGQFQDLGYTVNYAKADAYQRPTASDPLTRAAVMGSYRLLSPAAAQRPASAQAAPATTPAKQASSRTEPTLISGSPEVPIRSFAATTPAVASGPGVSAKTAPRLTAFASWRAIRKS